MPDPPIINEMLVNLQKENQHGSALTSEDGGEAFKEKKHQPQQDAENIAGAADTEVDSSNRSSKLSQEKSRSATSSSILTLIPLFSYIQVRVAKVTWLAVVRKDQLSYKISFLNRSFIIL